MKTMSDYHSLYLKCDALFLADVFVKFRNSALKSHGLSPSHYLSARALSRDAMLIFAKVSLAYFRCWYVFVLWERYERWSFIRIMSERYSKTNNKYLKSYDPKQDSKHICLNANNLYAYAISKSFPMGWFKWIDPKEVWRK